MTISTQDYANDHDSTLLQLMKAQNWTEARQHFADQAHITDEYGNTPLHVAIGFGAPTAFCLDLLQLHPQAARAHGTDEWLPLHVAAMWARVDETVVEALIRAYPQGLDDKGQEGSIKGKTPRHFAKSRNSKFGYLLERSTEDWMQIIADEEQNNQNQGGRT